MLIGGDGISNDVITLGMCFSMFVYIHAHFHFMLIGGNLTAQSTGSHRGIRGGIQIPEGHSWKLSFLFPPGELARRLVASSLNTVLYPNLIAMHLVRRANSSPAWREKQDWLVQKFVTATLRQASSFSFSLKKKEEGSARRVTSIHLIEKTLSLEKYKPWTIGPNGFMARTLLMLQI